MRPRLLLIIAGLFVLRLFAFGLVEGLHPAIAHDYCKWDCNWYLGLASNGYMLHPNVTLGPTYAQANWAFFPLYPLAVHLLALLLPSYYLAGIVAANFFLLLFVVVAVLYLQHRRPGTNPVALAAFLLAFPYGVYFSLSYTESLYGLLVTAALYGLAAERLTLSAGLAGLVSATRVPGILFTPIVVLRAFVPILVAWRADDRGRVLRNIADGLLPVALAPLGLFLFMAYLYAHVGDGLAFAHIQAGWARHTASPFATLYLNRHQHDWKQIFARHSQSAVFDECSAIAGLVLCLRLLWLRMWAECWVLAGTIMLGLSAGLVSMERYVLANPVFLIFLFDWLWQSVWFRRGFLPVLAGCFGLQLYFAHCWLEAYNFLI